MMLRNGCNIFTLKKLLGHNSFSSTARYIKCDTSDLEEAPAISHEWGFLYDRDTKNISSNAR